MKGYPMWLRSMLKLVAQATSQVRAGEAGRSTTVGRRGRRRAGPNSVSAGLINANTALDLVTANYFDNTVAVLLNQGNGNFAAAASYSVGPSPWGVATGDFNRDGRADVVTANFAGNNVSVLLSQANGTL